MNGLFRHIADKFQNFSVVDAFDILVMAVILYLFFLFLKRNNASVLFKCFAVFLVICLVAAGVGMKATSQFLKVFYTSLLVLFAVIFALELKRDVWKFNVGKHDYQPGKETCSEEDLHDAAQEIVKAVQNLAKNDVGALIVFAQKNVPSHIIESGVVLNALVSSPLIETIFIDKAPMHDGAIVIHNNKILAAGCFLPLTQDINVPKELGTRHRAAIGITEAEDVTSVVVSEETGVISVVQDGKMKRYIDGPMLTSILEHVFHIEGGVKNGRMYKR